jgi:hypothetical protein
MKLIPASAIAKQMPTSWSMDRFLFHISFRFLAKCSIYPRLSGMYSKQRSAHVALVPVVPRTLQTAFFEVGA